MDTMHRARKTLENIANTSFDKSLAKCVYLLASESLQCENEIRAQIDSLICANYDEDITADKKLPALYSMHGLDSICNYFEEVYLKSYRRLLSDKHLGSSIKSLVQNHLQLFISSLTQLRLFNDVKSAAN
ncbi:MAG: hypothetical protein JO072_00590 [Parafilimonas sp.]|nr:hypothetical protein [Parafilimonas sp.]